MKKWIFTLMLITLCLGGLVNAQDANEPAEYVTLRILTEPEFADGVANIEGWLGYGRDDSEAGIVLGYESWQEAGGQESKFSIGLFTMYHLPDIRATIENILWPAEWLPPDLTAEPAVGISGLYDIDGHGLKISTIIEMKVYKSFAVQTKYNIFSSDIEVLDDWQMGLSYNWQW